MIRQTSQRTYKKGLISCLPFNAKQCDLIVISPNNSKNILILTSLEIWQVREHGREDFRNSQKLYFLKPPWRQYVTESINIAPLDRPWHFITTAMLQEVFLDVDVDFCATPKVQLCPCSDNHATRTRETSRFIYFSFFQYFFGHFIIVRHSTSEQAEGTDTKPRY